MDYKKLITRIRALLLAPKAEWPIIANEPETPASLYKNYVLIVAAIPALAGFIRGSILGYADQYVETTRVEIGAALSGIIVQYVLTLLSVYLLAFIIDALAPSFGGHRNPMQALKAAAYSFTATWVANVGLLLPSALSFLVLIAGAIYGVYLLYTGLPHTMRSPVERTPGYTAVVIVAAIILSAAIGTWVRGVTRTRPHSYTSACSLVSDAECGASQAALRSESNLQYGTPCSRCSGRLELHGRTLPARSEIFHD